MSRWLPQVLSGFLLAGCSVIGVRDGTEEPKFSTIARVGDVEIRQYGARIAAETTVEADEDAARSAGFRRIAGYIFGGNKSQSKIAMTAPVSQSSASETIAMTAPVAQSLDANGRWVIRFFMPASATLQTLPVPDDANVHLVEVPPETMAVIRFSGLPGVEAVAKNRNALISKLQNSVWKPEGVPVAWFYDPPWAIPFLRRNEIAVAVAKSPAGTSP